MMKVIRIFSDDETRFPVLSKKKKKKKNSIHIEVARVLDMSKFCQIVMGAAGCGKSSYCAAMEQHCSMNRRTVHVMNCDPAAEDLAVRRVVGLKKRGGMRMREAYAFPLFRLCSTVQASTFVS
jgi:Conserved hypothetical ATP binding protein